MCSKRITGTRTGNNKSAALPMNKSAALPPAKGTPEGSLYAWVQSIPFLERPAIAGRHSSRIVLAVSSFRVYRETRRSPVRRDKAPLRPLRRKPLPRRVRALPRRGRRRCTLKPTERRVRALPRRGWRRWFCHKPLPRRVRGRGRWSTTRGCRDVGRGGLFVFRWV